MSDLLLSPNFRLDELERSQIAARRGIDNTLPIDLLQNAMRTAAMLQRVRDHLSRLAGRDIPIQITSGYRSPEVNRLVGGSPRSDHLYGLAVDWVAPSFGAASTIVRVLAPHVGPLGIGQLIDEYPPRGWIHTSAKVPEAETNRVLVIDANGARPLLA